MRKVTNYAFICVTALIFSFWVESALNQELDGVIKDQIIELVTVEGVRDRLYQAGELKDSISKTELVNAQQLKDQQASSLIDALQSAIGIRVSNECSMCCLLYTSPSPRDY